MFGYNYNYSYTTYFTAQDNLLFIKGTLSIFSCIVLCSVWGQSFCYFGLDLDLGSETDFSRLFDVDGLHLIAYSR